MERCDGPSKTTASGTPYAFTRTNTGIPTERPSNYGQSLGRYWSELSRQSWPTAQGSGFKDVSRSHNTEITHVYHSIHTSIKSVQYWPPASLL